MPATAFAQRFAPLSDTQLPMVEIGEGPPIVFMHGALGDWRTWARVLEHTPRYCRAIAYTQRWFGADARDHGAKAFGTRQQSDDLIAFLDALSLDAAHVVAWSFSAHSALAAAVRFPARVLSLRLYDLGFPTFVEDPALRSEIEVSGLRLFERVSASLVRGDRLGAVRALIDASAGEGHFDSQPEAVREIHVSNGSTIELLFRQTPPEPLSAFDLRNIRTPVRIAWGKASGVYRMVSKEAAKLIPDASGIEIGEANHLWPELAPKAFAHFATNGLAPG